MEEIESSLSETLKNSDLKSIAGDFGEIAIDSLLEDGVLKDIPVIGALQGIYSASRSVSNYLFSKKLIKFISALSELTSQERADVIKKLESNDGYFKKVGETLVLLIERMDDMQKPEMLAIAFRSLAKNKIDIDQFKRLTHAIDRLQVYYIPYLKAFYNREAVPDELLPSLFGAGLVGLDVGIDDIPTEFGRNKLGKLFIDVILEA